MAECSTSRSELSYEHVVEAAEYVKEQLKGFRPRVGLVCGSGLGELTSMLDARNLPSVPMSDLPHLEYLKPSVGGHSGKLLFGYVHDVEVMIAEGRVHPYEGHTHLQCVLPILLMRKLGVTHVILTNAAGSMNSAMKVGSLVLLKDQIDLPGICGSNPLFGITDPRFFSNEFGPGSRFIAVANCYDEALQRSAMQVARNELKFTTEEVNEGVYCRVAGPYYETHAEVALLHKAFGGDVVGMSTTYEAVVAFQCSMKVLGITVVTDMCDDVANVSHQQVVEAAQAGSVKLAKLISKFIELELVRLQPPTDAAGEEEQQHS